MVQGANQEVWRPPKALMGCAMASHPHQCTCMEAQPSSSSMGLFSAIWAICLGKRQKGERLAADCVLPTARPLV